MPPELARTSDVSTADASTPDASTPDVSTPDASEDRARTRLKPRRARPRRYSPVAPYINRLTVTLPEEKPKRRKWWRITTGRIGIGLTLVGFAVGALYFILSFSASDQTTLRQARLAIWKDCQDREGLRNSRVCQFYGQFSYSSIYLGDVSDSDEKTVLNQARCVGTPQCVAYMRLMKSPAQMRTLMVDEIRANMKKGYYTEEADRQAIDRGQWYL